MNPTNLNDYFKSQGKTLPAISERSGDATKAGISNYSGTAEQNNQLLNYYIKGTNQGSSPSTNTSVSSPYTINSSSLKQTNPVPLANPNVDAYSYTSQINNVANDLSNQVNLQQSEVDAWREKARSGSNTVSNLQALLGGKTEDMNKTYQDTGVTALYGQLSDLNAQATGLKNEAAAIPIQIQNEFAGRGATEGGVAPVTSARLRDNALKSLSLGQQAAIATANYDKAKVYADGLIEAKYSKITAEIEAAKTNLQNLREFDLTPAENKLLKTQEMAQNAKLTAIQEQKDNEKSIQDLIIKAAGQGADQTTLKRASSAKSPQEAAIALGQWAGDYWQIEKFKADMAATQRQNISTNGYATDIVGLKKLTGEQVSMQQFMNAIAANESGGQANPYTAVSPTNRNGQKAYGKYQILESNIPAWSKEALGRSVSLQEFLTNPDIQENIARVQMEKIYNKYGNYDDLAAVWFSGRPLSGNNSSDVTGTTVPTYVQRMRKNLGLVAGGGSQQFSSEVMGYVEQINSGKLKLTNVPQNLRGKVASAMSTVDANDPIKKAQVDMAVDGVNKLNTALAGIGGIAGIGGANIAGSNMLGRADLTNFFSGDKNVVLGYIDNILSESTLNQLIKAKESGATFGALSNQELGLLERSATVLNKWAIRDSLTGALEGFSVPEENVIKELNNIKSKLEKAIPEGYSQTSNNTALDNLLGKVDSNFETSGSTVPLAAYGQSFTR